MNEISTTTIEQINTLYKDLSALFVNSVEKAIEMGDLLLEAKKTLDHGQFKPWIEEHFTFSYRTAVNWMNAALNKKEIRRMTKGTKALALTDAYSLGVARAVTPKGTGESNGSTRQGLPRKASDMAQALWDHAPSVPLERYRVCANGGTVLMKTSDMRDAIMICTVTMEPIRGCEEAYEQLNNGLQSLFEQYYAVLEQYEKQSGVVSEDTPRPRKLRNVSEGEEDGAE